MLRTAFPRQTGFTLIEVLVAVLVLSVGVLGLVGLETLSVKNNTSAYYRSQATILAYELTDKIRANPDADYVAALSNRAITDACFSFSSAVTGSCSATERARTDSELWYTALKQALPGARASLATASAGSLPDVLTLTLTWDDNRDGQAAESLSITFTGR